MDRQHLPILITVGIRARHSLPRPTRQRMYWAVFPKSFDTLPLGSFLETPNDVEAAASLLVNRIKEAQQTATTFHPVQTSCRGTKKINTLARRLAITVRDYRGRDDRPCKRPHEKSLPIKTPIHKTTTPVLSITNRSEARCYNALAQAEAIAEYLEGQFTPNPPANSPATQEHYARVEEDVSKTVGVVSPTKRRPGMRQHKSSIPHLHPQEKGCGRSANECPDGTVSDRVQILRSGPLRFNWSKFDPSNWSLLKDESEKNQK
ncbi:hypothetical protein EVAR_717_1 [Eumeta japonica]|uniref:Uncharacterized protein n=1 Tax=Eumeta variegata TaxID=151549 RepID=A0A4C1SBT6_EUMVA|nr:hypothetical protein EVAR_717_1 [Eumeta japonica]